MVQRIAERLCEQRMEPWLDQWSLTGGDRWQHAIAEGLYASRSCAVVVGPHGLGDWAREELGVALDRAAKDRGFRLFVVLLPGAPELSDPSLAFVRMRSWVDLRAGVDDPDGFQDLVSAITGSPRRRQPAAVDVTPEICPFRGLERFEEEHAPYFFGREDDVGMIVEKLRTSRFLAVLGPSGSGKSSLLRAGLVPAVRGGVLPGSAGWTVGVVAPGPRPLVTLAAQLTNQFPGEAVHHSLDRLAADRRSLDLTVSLALHERPHPDRVLLVVDQFEELFTLGDDEAGRSAFLDNLLHAATVPGGRTVVVVGMRADFYHRCAPYPELRTLLADQQFLVGPLDADGLRRAIEEPARRVALEVEAGLVDTIVADVGSRPGALPLLEHVLFELWHRRRGTMLTLEAYVAAGGVEGALAKRADTVYASLTPAQQQIARRVLLRLVQPGEGTDDTRRRAEMAELVTRPEDEPDVDAVLTAFADQRLLTIGRDEVSGARVVDIAHEALIRGWPELRGWIDDERDELRAQRHLTTAASDWDRAGRRDDDLYSGARLASWNERGLDGLTELELAFLTSSREREARQRAAGRRRARLAVGGTLAAVTAVAVVAIVGLWQVSNQRDAASQQRDVALSRELVNQSDAQATDDPQLAALLSLAAFKLHESAETRGALLRRVVQTQGVDQFLGDRSASVGTVAFSPDGRTLASGGLEGITLWDVAGRSRLATLDGHSAAVANVAFSPDGSTLASAGLDGKVILWDVAGRSQQAALTGNTALSTSVAFSPDGRTLAVGGLPEEGGDGEVVLWDVAGRSQQATLTGRIGASVAFTPDGQVLATGGVEGEIGLWDVAGRSQQASLTGQTGFVLGLAFSPDGTKLATASVGEGVGEGEVKLWDVAERRALAGPGFGARSAAFSPDGNTLAYGRENGNELVLWDMAEDTEVELRGHADRLRGIAFSPDGHTLASAGTEHQVVLWDSDDRLAPGSPFGPSGYVVNVSFSPDGRTLATLGRDNPDTGRPVTLWDVATGTASGEIPVGHADGGVFFSPDGRLLFVGQDDRRSIALYEVESRALTATLTADSVMRFLAVSDDSRMLAVVYENGSVGLWDLASRSLAATLTPDTGQVGSVGFSPDGRTLATGGLDNRVLLWDVATRAQVAVLTGHTDAVVDIAFSPDGRTLASAGRDDRVILWDVAARAQRATLPTEKGVTELAFSPDGRMLALEEGAFGGIGLWDVDERLRLGGFGQPGSSSSLSSFSPDGRTLATTGLDGIFLWQVDTESWERRLCTIVGRELTEAEWDLYLPGQAQQGSC